MSDIQLYHGDSLEVMDTLIALGVKVDCVITDPPYRTISGGRNDSLSVEKWNSPTGILSKNDGKIFENNDVNHEEWIKKVYQLLKDNTDFYCMTNALNLFKIHDICIKTGFKFHNLLGWKKNNATPNRWYMKNVEYVLYFYKGKAKSINDMGSKTIHEFNNILENKLHPTEKPVDLMKLYVSNSTKEGDIILDPFMGSGTTGVACKCLNRDFIGVEIDEKYFNIAKYRIILERL